MKRKTGLFFLIAAAVALPLFGQEAEDVSVAENAESAVESAEGEGVQENESGDLNESAETLSESDEEGEFVVRHADQDRKRQYALSVQILDPLVKSLVSFREFDFAGEPFTSRLIIPSFSFESQFEVHRYVTLGIKASIIPELFTNPFYQGVRGGSHYSDPQLTYPDAALEEEEWANRVYDDESEYYLNMHFLVDLTARVLPFGEGLDTLKGFYIKAGGYFGFSIFQNPYLTYEESQEVSVAGEIDSAGLPFFYSREVDESGNGEELYEFVFGVVVGLGWQFVFPSGFFLDVGADLTYDNIRRLIPSVPGLGWNANCSVGYAW